jgi:alpha-beta hydrolase superfamily lysophospholipase
MFSGTGPSDRNWDSPPLVTGAPAAQIADALTAAGYAVFRFDDRGVGKSTGGVHSATFWNLVSDARSIVAGVKAQPEVDPFNVYVAGHSEGALIALILGSEDPTLGGVISLAGPSRSLDKVIVEQLNAMAADESIPASEREKAARMIPKMSEIIAKARAGERGVIDGISLPWLREHMSVNPLDYAARQRSPLLIVQGLDDLMVLSKNANDLKEAALANEVDTTVEMIARMNHFLMQFPYNNPEFDASNPTKVVARAVDAMIQWIKEKSKL